MKEENPKTEEENKETTVEEQTEEENSAQQEQITEKTKESETKNQKKKISFKQIPLYLWALFLAAAIILGIALGIYLKPLPSVPVIEPIGSVDENKPVEIELIYSKDCPFCQKHNTIFDTFTFYKIPFSVKEIEASSSEGTQKIAAFEINILPTALIPVQQMNRFQEIKLEIEKSFKKTGNYYVVPESNLNSSKIYSRMYLEPVYPDDCKQADQNSMIYIFDDPYNELAIKRYLALSEPLTKFKDNVIVRFENIFASTSTLDSDANQFLRKETGKFLICASAQDLFLDGYTEVLSKYCGSDENITFEKIAVCPINPHFGTPLTLLELDKASENLPNINIDDLKSCLTLADLYLDDSVVRATKHGITRTGTAIVDCKYHVPYETLENAICESRPNIELCATNEQQ